MHRDDLNCVASNYNVVIKTKYTSIFKSLLKLKLKCSLKVTASLFMADLSSYWFGLAWIVFIESYQVCEATQVEEHSSGQLWDMSSQRNSLSTTCVRWRAKIMWVKQMRRMAINFLADARGDLCSGESDSKKRWVAGIKGLRPQSGPLLPLHGATHGCEEWKGSKTRTPVSHRWLFHC